MAEVVVARKNRPLIDLLATPRILALAGVIAPIMFWIILIVAGLPSMLVGILSLILFAAYMWGGDLVRPWIGLEQRVLLGVTLGWLEVMAIRLLILSPWPQAVKVWQEA